MSFIKTAKVLNFLNSPMVPKTCYFFLNQILCILAFWRNYIERIERKFQSWRANIVVAFIVVLNFRRVTGILDLGECQSLVF